MQFCVQLYIDIWKTIPYLQANQPRIDLTLRILIASFSLARLSNNQW